MLAWSLAHEAQLMRLSEAFGVVLTPLVDPGDLPAHDPCRPGPKDHVRLPMTRAEIADYLGLTIETVSRVLTRLKTTGVIRLLDLHELRIEAPDRLRAIAEGEA